MDNRVVFNEFGEALVREERMGTGMYTLHEGCRGITSRVNVSEDYDVILCRNCNLRIHIPVTVKTWCDFEDYFSILRGEDG